MLSSEHVLVVCMCSLVIIDVRRAGWWVDMIAWFGSVHSALHVRRLLETTS
jgi:hypothetical protein